MTVNDGSTGSAKTKKYVVFSVNNDNEPLFILASDFKNNSRIYFDTCIKFALIFEEEEKVVIPILMKKLFPDHLYTVSQL